MTRSFLELGATALCKGSPGWLLQAVKVVVANDHQRVGSVSLRQVKVMRGHGIGGNLMATLPFEEMRMEWYWVIHSGLWERRFFTEARRVFPNDPMLAERAALEAQDHLRGKLQQLSAPQPDAYILTAFRHELVDFARREFGYKRPPAWVQRLGRLWEEVFRLLCVYGRHPEEIKGSLVFGHRRHTYVEDPDQQARQAVVEEAIRIILAKVTDCLQRISVSPILRSVDGDTEVSVVDTLADGEGSIEDRAERDALEHILEALAALLDPAKNPSAPAYHLSDIFYLRFDQIRKSLLLTDDERILLRMIFHEGMSVAEVARQLGTPEHVTRRAKARVQERIRQALADAGISGSDLLQLMGAET